MAKLVLPKHLRPATRTWLRRLAEDYDFESHQLKLLVQAGEVLDRIHQAQAQVTKDGCYFIDRYGQPRSHPGLADERGNRVLLARLLRELNLSAEAPESRPPGLKY